MTDAERPRRRLLNGLRARLVLMMSLALLPIGLIAVYQTRVVSQKDVAETEQALLGQIEQAALKQRLAIQTAMGMAIALAADAETLLLDVERCRGTVARLMDLDMGFSFAGLIETTGDSVCSSASEPFVARDTQSFRSWMASAEPEVRVVANAQISGETVISISAPYFRDGVMAGRASLSLPHRALSAPEEDAPPGALLDLVTFTDAGEIAALYGAPEDVADRLPNGLGLASLASGIPRAFSARNRLGEDRIYTIAPVEPDQLYVLGIWDRSLMLREQLGSRLPALVFPLLMWLTSLLVVIMAVHRLVLRHVRALRRQMVRFARDRTLIEDSRFRDMPAEVEQIQESFNTMAYSLMQDEARLENAVREKSVLIREIHHRVKNNLQLISSIINMQIRNSDDSETKSSLRRVQDRVLSLATIHRDLYQTNSGGQVDVGHLIAEIIEKSADIATATPNELKIERDVERVMLFPDQAVPLSLLASEATTNAMKYVSAARGRDKTIRVSLKQNEDKKLVFALSNTSSGAANGVESTGMGSKLINAFAIQLGAEIETLKTEHDYTLRVVFEAADFIPEAETY